MGRTRGFSLALVIVVGGLVTLAAFTIATMSTTHMNLAQSQSSRLQAVNLAEAAINQTLSRLHANPQYGQDRLPVVTVQPDPSNADRGVVTFQLDPTQPYSTNNVGGSTNVTGYATQGVASMVAPSCVQLLGIGHCGNQVEYVEEFITVPVYPYALAAAGQLVSSGAVTVKGAPNVSTAASVLNGWAQDTPVNVGADSLINFTVTSYISGDMVSPGSIFITPDSYLGGSLKTDSVLLPRQLDATLFDPSGHTDLTVVTGGTISGQLTGEYRAAADVTASDITLSNAVLWVDGNLTITGACHGTGAIMATKSITMTDTSDLTGVATDRLALLANQNLNLSGGGFFQGLVFCKGNMIGSNLTVIGSCVSAPTTGPSNISLDSGFTVVYTPDAGGIKFNTAVVTPDALMSGMSQAPFCDWGSPPPLQSEAVVNLNQVPASANGIRQQVIQAVLNNPNHCNFWTVPDPNNWLGQQQFFPTGNPLTMPQGTNPGDVSQFRINTYVIQAPAQWGSGTDFLVIRPVVDGLQVNGNQFTFDPTQTTFAVSEEWTFDSSGAFLSGPPGVGPIDQNYLNNWFSNHPSASPVLLTDVINEVNTNVQAAVNVCNTNLTAAAAAGYNVDVSLNKFLGDTAPYQVIGWRIIH